MNTSTKKGFTLIELLVVIAIIGLLSAVVLASLSTARRKGQDSAIKEQLTSFRSQAALYYSNTPNYGGSAGAEGRRLNFDAAGTVQSYSPSYTGSQVQNFCTLSAPLAKMLGKAASVSGGLAYCAVGVGGASYAAYTQLPTAEGTYFCVDSKGFSGVVTANPGTTGYYYMIGQAEAGGGPDEARCK